MHPASNQQQNHPRQSPIIAVSESRNHAPSPQSQCQPQTSGATMRLTAIQQLRLREKVKMDVITHYRENRGMYPTFIRQRRDLIINRVLTGSSLEEAFAAEAQRRPARR